MEDDDDEPVDHKPEVEEKCMPKCEKFVKLYEACAERIKGDETGEAHCTVREARRRGETRETRTSERGRRRRAETDSGRRWRAQGQYFDMYKCVDECAKDEVMRRTA